MRRLAVAISALLACSSALAAQTSISDSALHTAAQLRE
ncbi:aminopeptidase [Xanthomonas bromi]|uniref:Aminopeptidase n=1 Tax=Xanthomonas bromi TaxID=56449 RepID=A0A1C3NQ41_9XANT|nr:aminopeptidase [Xanthomonas bromi]